MKTTIRLTGICLLMLIVFSCASGGGSYGERGIAVEELPPVEGDIAVFPQLGHRGVLSIAYSPNGKHIVSGGNDTSIRIWDAQNGRELMSLFGHSDSVLSVAYSPNGRYIVSGSQDKTVRIWDTISGKELRSLTGHTYYVTSVAYSPDGRYIVSGDENGTIRICDAQNGRELRDLLEDSEYFESPSIAYSPDGKHIAVSWANIEGIRIWNVESGTILRILSGDEDYTGLSVVYSPDGKRIMSGGGSAGVGGGIRIWDAQNGRMLRSISVNTKAVNTVAWSPDGKNIVSGSEDGTIKIWNAENGRELRTLSGHAYDVNSVAYSPDGKRIISGSGDSTIRIWDTESGRELLTLLRQSEYAGIIAYSPIEQSIISSYSGKVKIWEIESGKGPQSLSGYDGTINSVAYSPDGKHIVLGTFNGTVEVWDTQSGSVLRTLSGHTGKVNSVAYSPNGQRIASGADDSTIRIWDAQSGRVLRTLSGHRDRVRSVAWSPDGKRIVSGSSDNTVRIWDAESGQELKSLPGLRRNMYSVTNFVYAAAWSPNGKYIVSGSMGGQFNDPSISIWDAESGIVLFSRYIGTVESLAYSPDGNHIVIGLWDSTVRILDAVSGEELQRFIGHRDSVRSVVYSPDGRQVISASMDGTVRIWDVSTGQEIAQFISFSGADSQLTTATRGLTVETQTAATSNEGEWLSITPDGYYNASPRGDRYLNVRVNNTVSGIDSYRTIFYNPDVVQARLQGRPDPKSKANVTIQQAAAIAPPEVAIQSPANFTTTNTATTNLSVVITSQSQPVKNIKILVNGRLIGRDELASVTSTGLQAERASLTVTGNQKTVNFTLPLELDPGNNRIEVVAFNGYSENRRYVDVTRNAPAGERPALPSLWVVAVGVNGYDNAGPRLGGMTSLNFAVADAKGLVDSLKAQEGRRYAKVNSMLIADGERLVPSAENIRQSFKFLEGADPRRDVVVLFLAGHGISAQEGKFFFLPKDAAMSDGKVDAGRAISGDEIMAVLDAPGNRLVFIDACQSGGVDSDRMVRSLMDTNAFVFAASRGNELSYESRELGHGYFTYSIMSALGGAPAALSEGRNVSVLSMSGFVKDDVPKRTGGRQNPSAYSLGFYDFPMAVIRQ